jgi:hypothetical protein
LSVKHHFGQFPVSLLQQIDQDLLLFVRHRKLINAATQNGKLYELS